MSTADELAAAIGLELYDRKLTLAVAESCTGGRLGDVLTNVPGSSEYFLGGVIAYSYDAKEHLLGVRHDTLFDHGAVSRQTALEMAEGVRRVFLTDLAVAITGIAGPGGGLPDKPVGLVYIALAARDFERCERYVWSDDRTGNKQRSVEAALSLIQDFLKAGVRAL
jgi:PncC family amidohydrolase